MIRSWLGHSSAIFITIAYTSFLNYPGLADAELGIFETTLWVFRNKDELGVAGGVVVAPVSSYG